MNAVPHSPQTSSPSAATGWLADDPPKAARQRTEQARAELGAKDPVMRELIEANPDFDYHAWRATLPVQGLFEALLFQIAAQQISVAAGNAIYGRLRGLFPGSTLTPERIAQLSADDLRGIGFSIRKTEYIRDLAGKQPTGRSTGLLIYRLRKPGNGSSPSEVSAPGPPMVPY
jgi:3-methyladenine DNA glycosylase/8-oxoguanine DNA glycosylase